uniref:Uncharacterized protein n=1 Tax=Tetranychus urticae TaxID=32264 RepID=T1KXW9_TETUR
MSVHSIVTVTETLLDLIPTFIVFQSYQKPSLNSGLNSRQLEALDPS